MSFWFNPGCGIQSCFAAGDYDYIILDNVGAVEYDVCFVLCGAKSSISFDEEIQIRDEYSINHLFNTV